MSGWYAMKRGWLDHEAFQPKGPWSRAEVWVWFVESACWKPTTIDIGGKPYTVPRGHLCYSERFLSAKFRWSRTALRTFLAQLEAHKVIEIGVAQTGPGARQKRSQVRLCNYEKYQSAETKTGQKENQNRTKEEQVNNKQFPPTEEADASQPIEFSILAKTVFDTGIRILCPYGSTEKEARALVGRWRKSATDTEILAAFDACHKNGTQDPIPYITEILKPAQAQPSIADIAARAKREGKI